VQVARKQFKDRMDSLSSSLEGCGSTETLVSLKSQKSLETNLVV